jgi:hypothetical protein
MNSGSGYFNQSVLNITKNHLPITNHQSLGLFIQFVTLLNKLQNLLSSDELLR